MRPWLQSPLGRRLSLNLNDFATPVVPTFTTNSMWALHRTAVIACDERSYLDAVMHAATVATPF